MRALFLLFFLTEIFVASQDSSAAPTDAALRVQASATHTGGNLALSIRMINLLDGLILVFNRPYDFSDYDVPAQIGQHFSQIRLLDDGAVALGMIVAPLPKSRLVELMIVPCATIIPAKSEIKDSFEIPLPLDEYNPYFPAVPNAETTLTTAQGVVIWVDYLVVTPDIEIADGQIPGCKDVSGFSRRMLRRGEQHIGGLQVPVRRRNDEFRN
jgi:hypothetical protein